MIKSISVRNFALIDDIEFDLEKGMTVLTGETGAGKSILLGAISLLLGKRADLSSAGDPEKKCVIEAEFDVSDLNLIHFFEQQQIDYEPLTIIRREILPGGRSRGFINDAPVNLNQMQALGKELVDIHSQFDTQTLNSQHYQLGVMDSMAGLEITMDEYQKLLRHYRKLEKEEKELSEELARSRRDLDYHQYLLQELDEIDLESVDQPQLELESEKLSNVEGIQETLHRIKAMMQQDAVGLMDQLFELRRELSSLSGFGEVYQSWADRSQSIIEELDDLSREIDRESDSLELDPERMSFVSEQLDHLQKLQDKHHVTDTDQLIGIREELRSQVDNSGQLEERIAQIQSELQATATKLSSLANKIHQGRKEIIRPFSDQFQEILADLGMPDAELNIILNHTAEFRDTGMDQLEWLFTANKGGRAGELAKVASGGELSRIMLAIKSILSRRKQLPTLIFDEIDTGVSGKIAEQMAIQMHQISRHSQLLAITHLAQVAAKGSHHLKVFKETDAVRTITHLKPLDEDARIVEIAQMIGGDQYSDSALAHARELLN
ncbi:DNA repair protein RecN [Aureitalea marina]|uniref:DNA repair protein RecN n=1 Tax=Aureitalea marina TaxID=930804 RepID=A0A2S7KN89_9FLAO|nr:DNA repair protein RecN [Aureitalea marina]PQB04023.1 DNA repair protein RecN [Aureitalea marina]